MDISVALCTYNGEGFLREQINSILAQSLTPNEIIVFDDSSDDGTQEILKEFNEKYPGLFSIHYNTTNFGPTRNFAQCIGQCTGDAIAVCDQDDIWRPRKLETQAEYLKKRRENLVFHNSTVVSESLAPLTDFWSSLTPVYGGQDKDPTEQLRMLMIRNYVQGASMVFNSNVREYILPIPESWDYDWWIALLVSIQSGGYAIDEQLLKYRQHQNQVTEGINNQRSLFDSIFLVGSKEYSKIRSGECEEYVDRWYTMLDRVNGFTPDELFVEKNTAMQLIRQKIEFLKYRCAMYTADEIWPRVEGIHECYSNNYYQMYSKGYKTAIADIIISQTV